MKSALRILATMACALAAQAFGGGLGGLEGKYAGPASVTAAVGAAGSATVDISTFHKDASRGVIAIDGTVYSDGNAVPLRTRIVFRDDTVVAESFLLGLQGVPVRTKAAKLRSDGTKLRVKLQAAEGAIFNGVQVSGTMNYRIILKDGQLLVNGRGTVRNGDGPPQQVVIAIVAAKLP